MERPRISVIMITYNQEDLVGRALDSLLTQKEYLYEICINDDCSTDGTWTVLMDYAARFPEWVKPVRNGQNLGIMQNTEAVWKRPSGDMVYDIAGDDECPPDYFRQVLQLVEDRSIDWKNELFCIYSDYMVIEPDGTRTVFKNSLAGKHDASKLKLRMLLSNRGACFSRKVLDLFEDVSVGRSLIAESTQDGQLALFARKSYYLPAVGCIYYSGIGISARMSRDEHLENRVDGYKMYAGFLEKHGHPFDRKDLAFIRFMEAYSTGRFRDCVRAYFASLDLSLGWKGLNLDRILFALRKKLHRKKRPAPDKKSIQFVAPFPPPVHGSALVSQQIRDSRLVNDTFSCDYVNLSTSRGVDEVGKNSLIKYIRLLASLSRLFGKLLTRRYDLCYLAITCHGRGFLKDAPFALLCRLFRRPVVIHQHNKGMSRDAGRRPYRSLLSSVYKNASVILLSDRLYPDIQAVVPRGRVFICPNGIPVSDTGPKEPSDDAPRLLFLSNLIASKGLWVLLDALQILNDGGRMCRCDIVGSETKDITADRLRQEIRKRNLDEAVTYHGKQVGEGKEKLLRQAALFVFPTFYENECFPLVILEAMAHSLPVITTDEGGIPDMVTDGENGLICRKQDPRSLADCIRRLMEDKDLRVRMGEEGHRRLKESFTEGQFEEKLVGILSQLTEK